MVLYSIYIYSCVIICAWTTGHSLMGRPRKVIAMLSACCSRKWRMYVTVKLIKVLCVCECMCVDRFVHTSDVIHTILYVVVPIRHLASFFLLASWY